MAAWGARGICIILGTLLAAALAPPAGAQTASQGPAASEGQPAAQSRQIPVKSVGNRRLAIALPDGREVLFPYFASRGIDDAAPEITSAVIVIHGAQRNADDYFGTAVDAARLAGKDPGVLPVIAPQFLSTVDVARFQLPPEILAWNGGIWLEGAEADGMGKGLSAFAVLDAFLMKLADKAQFPALDRITVAGHSAGAQMVQRYAIVSQVDKKLRAAGIATRYLVANPSAYLYLTEERPAAGGLFRPAEREGCPSVNRYRYGLEDVNPYIAATGTVGLRAAFATRDVVYLLGGADTDPAHPALDRGCAAMAQGPSRLERGINYFRYLTTLYGPDIDAHQRLFIVPGIAHDFAGMFRSRCGLSQLFGSAKC